MKILSSGLRGLERQAGTIVVAAANRLEKHWQSNKDIRFKERADPVTDYDVSIEATLRQQLGTLVPEAGFIVEEGESAQAERYNWIIDPIDQTKNFVGQIPLFYVQVALLRDDIPILGVIYNPVSRQLISASRGNGATINGDKPQLTAKQFLHEAIVDVDFGDASHLPWKMEAFEKVAKAAFRVRSTGSAYAPYLLTGGIDAYLVINEKTKLVDQLPRIIIAREAGLAFEEYTLKDHKVLVAGKPSIARELLKCITE